MKENLKKNEAITLISLVVTIIVLIILAGISINLILGQDGIINKAKEAKQNMEYAQIEEQEQLNVLYDQMTGQSNGSISNDETSKLIEFKKQIASAITDMGVETSANADTSTIVSNIRKIQSKASDISYNNSSSNLEAATVQSAIDEVNESVYPISSDFTISEITLDLEANTQTYVNSDIFTLPEGTREVWIMHAVEATMGGYNRIIKGLNCNVIDFSLNRGLYYWTPDNKINLSYFYNNVHNTKVHIWIAYK